eukprot:Selendium_serpulae@DN6216_c0_g1_i1.p1
MAHRVDPMQYGAPSRMTPPFEPPPYDYPGAATYGGQNQVVQVGPPPIPTPYFLGKTYKVSYGVDFVLLNIILFLMICTLILIPALNSVHTEYNVHWGFWVLIFIFWMVLVICFVYTILDSVPLEVTRKATEYELKVGCGRHRIPYNEIAYIRLLGLQDYFINWESGNGSRTTMFKPAVQIKSYRPGASIVFNPRCGAQEFMSENIPNDSMADRGDPGQTHGAPVRDDTSTSLSGMMFATKEV